MHRTAYWSKHPQQVGSVYLSASGSGYTGDCPATDFGKPYSDEVYYNDNNNGDSDVMIMMVYSCCYLFAISAAFAISQDWKPSDDNLSPWLPNQTNLKAWREKLEVVTKLNGASFTEAVIPSYRDMGVAINAFRFSQKYQLWWCRTIFGDNHTKATPNYIFHSAARPERWSKWFFVLMSKLFNNVYDTFYK